MRGGIWIPFSGAHQKAIEGINSLLTSGIQNVHLNPSDLAFTFAAKMELKSASGRRRLRATAACIPCRKGRTRV